MHANEIETYKRTLKLTKRQREIIVGTLLGDGHLETQNKGRTYRLKIEHTIKQREYVDWLCKELKSLVRTRPYAREGKSQFSTEYIKYGFVTYSLGSLRFYGQQFYDASGKKTIPKLIHRLLSPLSIAIWYLDDGSYKSDKHRTYIIHSHGYTRSDLVRIQATLASMGVRTALHRQGYSGKLYWRIYILSESAAAFRKMVEPIVNNIPTMRYKLGNTMPKG